VSLRTAHPLELRALPALLALLAPGHIWSAPGDIDTTFRYPVPKTLVADSTGVVKMPDGWLVVHSILDEAPGTGATLEVRRVDSEGNAVASFGNGGSVLQTFDATPINVATAGTRLQSGAVVLGGFRNINSTERVAALVRLDANGQLDTTFGADGGIVTVNVPGDGDRVGAIGELPDGRVVAVIYSTVHVDYDCDTDYVTPVFVYNDASGSLVAQVGNALFDSHYSGASCRKHLSAHFGADSVVLLGNEAGIFQATLTNSSQPSSLVATNWRYGPFIQNAQLGLIYTVADGDGISVRHTRSRYRSRARQVSGARRTRARSRSKDNLGTAISPAGAVTRCSPTSSWRSPTR
jgi:hypothetical protein